MIHEPWDRVLKNAGLLGEDMTAQKPVAPRFGNKALDQRPEEALRFTRALTMLFIELNKVKDLNPNDLMSGIKKMMAINTICIKMTKLNLYIHSSTFVLLIHALVFVQAQFPQVDPQEGEEAENNPYAKLTEMASEAFELIKAELRSTEPNVGIPEVSPIFSIIDQIGKTLIAMLKT